MKKLTKYGIAGLGVAGTATAIAVPIALHKNDKEVVGPRHKESDVILTDASGKDITKANFNNAIKKDEQVSSSIITSVDKASVFINYDAEQKGSLKLQEAYFNWELASLKKEYDVSTTSDERKREIEAKAAKLTDKIAKLQSPDDAFYKDDNFASDYPKVLKPINVLKADRDSYYEDDKHAVVDAYDTKAEGESVWIEEMQKKYNGAKTKEEAIAYEVYNSIKNVAVAKYKYKLNSEFTKEMKDAVKVSYDKTSKAFTIGSDKVFTFLEKAKEKGKNGADSDLVYFVSTLSRIPAEIPVEIDQADQGIISLSKANLVHTYHLLIPAIPDKNGETLPWDIKKEDLIGKAGSSSYGLLSFIGNGNMFDNIHPQSGTYVFSDEHLTDTDKLFVQMGTSQPSAPKDGSLGINSKIDSLKGMVPGFIMGSIEGLSDKTGTPATGVTTGETILDTIKNKLSDWLSTSNPTGSAIADQKSLVQVINSMTDQEIKQTFGSIFRDAFKDGATYGHKIYYKISDHAYIVISQFGIHIVHIDNYGDAASLAKAINDDLQKAADDQGTSNSKMDYSKLFSISNDEHSRLYQLLNGTGSDSTEFIKKLENGYNKDSNKKDGSQIPDQIKTDGSKMPWSDVLTQIKKAFEDEIGTKAFKTVQQVLGTNIETYLTTNYDSGAIIPLDTSSPSLTADAQKIYTDAIALATPGGRP